MCAAESITLFDTKPFAQVALPVPLASAFTYRVPDAMRERLFVGCRVEVPFGKRVLSGIVLEFAEQSSLKPSVIKPIRDVYETYLPQPLLKLTRWIADYYGCTVGEAAQSVLPPLLQRAKRASALQGVVKLQDGDAAAQRAALKRAPKQLALLERLFELGPLDVDDVHQLGFTTAHIKALLEKGVAELGAPDLSSPLDAVDPEVVVLNDEQQAASTRIEALLDKRSFAPMLLDGVTGSGKTELYIRAARRVLNDGGGCIVLVPEIGLLPQAIARYRRVFGDRIAILHSRLTGAERFRMWCRIESGECNIVLGPRSAVFSPVNDLRLIIVDEEQDDSYKQDDKPRYHARNVALIRGKFEDAAVLLGSATPSAESLHHALAGRYEYLRLSKRVGSSRLPDMAFVDMREAEVSGEFFSTALLERLDHHLSRKRQAILFLNKRGHARFVQCNACGWTASCENCDISLTYHRVNNRLRCHFCGYSRRAAEQCDECKSKKLRFSGVGTQRIELDLASCFPGVGILRMDADTTSGKDGHRRVLEQFSTGEYPILIGTQMVTKGHHFPGVGLVGVLFGEESLNYPDFRAAERTFQQLTQVAGRAGRGAEPGEVVIQTFTPDHHVFAHLAVHDYSGFMKEELKARKDLHYPPYARLVLASCSATKPELLQHVVSIWAGRMRALLVPRGIDVLGPAAPVIARVKNRYREHILIKGALSNADKNEALASFAEVAQRVPGGRGVDLRWDVDPESFY